MSDTPMSAASFIAGLASDAARMTDDELLAQINAHDPFDEEFAKRFRALAAERDALDEACITWSEVSQRNYQRAKAAEAEIARFRDVRRWYFYPIEMPLTEDGQGPATVGIDAARLSYEVWDVCLNKHASFDNLPDAINEAIRLNAALAAMEGRTMCHDLELYLDFAEQVKRIEELEAKLKTSEEIGRAFEEDAGQLRTKLAKAMEALELIFVACDQGRMIPRSGAGGMTVEANIRGSVYTGVPAWPLEEARTTLAELKGQDQ